MIQILCNGRWLNLPPNSSMRVEEISSYFRDEVFQGSHSFPFDLPVTPNNLRALGLVNIVEAVDVFPTHTVQVYFKGTHRYTCKLIIQQANRLGIKINLATGIASLNVLSKKLPELQLGGDRVVGNVSQDLVDHANLVVAEFYPNIDYTFPCVYNPEFYGDSNLDYQNIINRYDMSSGSFMVNTTTAPKNQNVMIPMVFVAYILKQGFGEEGWTVRGSFLDDPELSQMIIYNNFALDGSVFIQATSQVHVCDPLVSKKIRFVDDFTPPNQDPPNFWDISNSWYTIPFAGAQVVNVNLSIAWAPTTANCFIEVELMHSTLGSVSSFSLFEGSTGLSQFTGTLLFNASGSDIGEQLYVQISLNDDNGVFLPVTIVEGMIQIGTTDINRYTTTINLKNHVPNITFADFITALRNSECLAFTPDFSTKTIYVDKVQQRLEAPTRENHTSLVDREREIVYEISKGFTFDFEFPEDDSLTDNNFKTYNVGQRLPDVTKYANLPSAVANIGKVCLVLNVNRLYISQPAGAGANWVEYSDFHPPVVIGLGEQSVKPKCAPMLMRYATNVGGQAVMPAVSQQGQSTLFAIGTSEFKDLRFMIWRGMQPGAAAATYPFASTTPYDFQGNKIGDRFIRWAETDGNYEAAWEGWITILERGRYIRRFVKLTLVDLLNLTEQKKYIGNLSFIYRRVSTNYANSIEESEVEMYQV